MSSPNYGRSIFSIILGICLIIIGIVANNVHELPLAITIASFAGSIVGVIAVLTGISFISFPLTTAENVNTP